MRIFYNPETRQQIIVMDNFACSIYLQSDETPAQKAGMIIAAHDANPQNISTCQEIDLTVAEPQLTIEDGPKEGSEKPETDNGDRVTNPQ